MLTESEVSYRSAFDIAADVAARRLSPVEVVETLLARWIHRRRERAGRGRPRADRHWHRWRRLLTYSGRLHGLLRLQAVVRACPHVPAESERIGGALRTAYQHGARCRAGAERPGW